MKWNIEQDNGGIVAGSKVDVPDTGDMFAHPDVPGLSYTDPLLAHTFHLQHPEEFEHRVDDDHIDSSYDQSHDVGLDG